MTNAKALVQERSRPMPADLPLPAVAPPTIKWPKGSLPNDSAYAGYLT